MSRGGARLGAGRKKGQKNKLTLERRRAVEAAADEIKRANPDAFNGDAHALLMAIYKNESLAPELRMDAAKTAIKFEKPAIAAIAAPAPQFQAPTTEKVEKDAESDHLAGLLKRYGFEAPAGPVPIKDVEPAKPAPQSTGPEHLKMLSERFAAAKRWQ
jgi:hypothetical protein